MGAWDAHHGTLAEPRPYGAVSYGMIAAWVASCPDVEDWGCGGGGLAGALAPGQRYVGVDGSRSPFASVRADLRVYRSDACAVVLRHVLEHNDEWAAILTNAVASFGARLAVVLFTPLVEETRVMFREPDYGNVPVIAFRLEDLAVFLAGVDYTVETIRSDTVFGVETLILASR